MVSTYHGRQDINGLTTESPGLVKKVLQWLDEDAYLAQEEVRRQIPI